MRAGQATLDAIELGLELPRRASRLLGQIQHGKLESNANHRGLREFARQLQRMANRLAPTMHLSATMVALGPVMAVYHPPGWERYSG